MLSYLDYFIYYSVKEKKFNRFYGLVTLEFCREELEESLTRKGNALGLIIATPQVTGFLAGKIAESKILLTGLCLAACGGISLFLVALLGGGLELLMVSLFLVVSSIGIINTTSVSIAMQEQGKNAGSASAWMGLFPNS